MGQPAQNNCPICWTPVCDLAQAAGISDRQLRKIIKQEEEPHPKTRRRLIRAFSLLDAVRLREEREIEAFRKWARQERDKTSLKELASKLGVTPSNLGSMIEGRRKPSKCAMKAYCQIADLN